MFPPPNIGGDGKVLKNVKFLSQNVYFCAFYAFFKHHKTVYKSPFQPEIQYGLNFIWKWGRLMYSVCGFRCLG